MVAIPARKTMLKKLGQVAHIVYIYIYICIYICIISIYIYTHTYNQVYTYIDATHSYTYQIVRI